MKQIVSFSGGKDSTAMLHMMIERGEQIDDIVFFDTGWEFPAILEHIDLVETNIDRTVTRLHPAKSFDYWLAERRVIGLTGEKKGKHYRTGQGWPSPFRRWCTRQKIDTIRKHLRSSRPYVSCLGIAADEIRRMDRRTDGVDRRYPLVEYDVSEAGALEYCRGLGYTWGGLYEIFHRVSCFCCPLQRIGELRKLWKHYPDLWLRMLDMEDRIQYPEGVSGGFRGYESVHNLDIRFKDEDRQMILGL